jgi:hypothetical protein
MAASTADALPLASGGKPVVVCMSVSGVASCAVLASRLEPLSFLRVCASACMFSSKNPL